MSRGGQSHSSQIPGPVKVEISPRLSLSLPACVCPHLCCVISGAAWHQPGPGILGWRDPGLGHQLGLAQRLREAFNFPHFSIKSKNVSIISNSCQIIGPRTTNCPDKTPQWFQTKQVKPGVSLCSAQLCGREGGRGRGQMACALQRVGPVPGLGSRYDDR